MLPPGELLATDLTGVRPLARVGAHVPLQDALVHGREAAVGALELLADHREVVHCGDRRSEKERKTTTTTTKKKRLVLNKALLNKPRRHFSVIAFN